MERHVTLGFLPSLIIKDQLLQCMMAAHRQTTIHLGAVVGELPSWTQFSPLCFKCSVVQYHLHLFLTCLLGGSKALVLNLQPFPKLLGEVTTLEW